MTKITFAREYSQPRGPGYPNPDNQQFQGTTVEFIQPVANVASLLNPAYAPLILDIQAKNITGRADDSTLTGVTNAVTGVTGNAFGAPKYRSAGFNGKPTIYMDGGSHLGLGRPQALLDALTNQDCTIATAYVVPTAGSNNSFYDGPLGQHAGGLTFRGNTGFGGGTFVVSNHAIQTSDNLFPVGTLIVHIQTVTPGNVTPTGKTLSRGYINGTGGTSNSGLTTGLSGTDQFVMGASEDYTVRSYPTFFRGHIIGCWAWGGSFRMKDVAQLTRWIHEQHNVPVPWANETYFRVTVENSIYDLGTQTFDTTAPAFVERGLGKPVIGRHTNLARTEADTTDMKAIVDRELPGLAAALGGGIKLLVMIGQWNNGNESAAFQAMFDSVKTADPNAICVGLTSTDIGKGNDGAGLATAEKDNEPQRQAYNAMLYNASNPRGVQTGVNGVDLMIPTHLNNKVGIPGSCFGTDRATFYVDTDHLKGNLTADCGHRQLGQITIASALQAAGYGN